MGSCVKNVEVLQSEFNENIGDLPFVLKPCAPSIVSGTEKIFKVMLDMAERLDKLEGEKKWL